MPLNPKMSRPQMIQEFAKGPTFAKTEATKGKKAAIRQAIAVSYAVKRRGK